MVVAISAVLGSVKIRNRAYIAPCAVIMNQTEVGENALVELGAVVTQNVEANKVVVGIPAKVIRDNK